MKEVFIIYQTDSTHSHNSRRIVGVADSLHTAIELLQPKLIEESGLDWHDKGYSYADQMLADLNSNLYAIKQTQNLEENFVIDTQPFNAVFIN